MLRGFEPPLLLQPEMAPARRVRHVNIVLGTVAMCTHAITIVLRRGEGFWAYTRVSIFFSGALRLITAVTLYCLGVTGACFPPTTLTFHSSVIVCSVYTLIALGCTQRMRYALSWQVARLRCYLRRPCFAVGRDASPMAPRAVVRPPAMGASPHDATLPQALARGCIVCMDAPNDHAFMTCGHLCVCASCARQIVEGSGRCPVCRGVVSGSLRTYLP